MFGPVWGCLGPVWLGSARLGPSRRSLARLEPARGCLPPPALERPEVSPAPIYIYHLGHSPDPIWGPDKLFFLSEPPLKHVAKHIPFLLNRIMFCPCSWGRFVRCVLDKSGAAFIAHPFAIHWWWQRKSAIQPKYVRTVNNTMVHCACIS